MRATLLVDNLGNEMLRSEHGISFLVETAEGSLLFDAGQTDIWMHNMKALGKDINALESIAVSHGHYDHTGGIASALEVSPDLKLFGHRDCLKSRYVTDGDSRRYIGIPDKAVGSHFEFNERPKKLLPGVTLSGEIPIRYSSPNADERRFLNGTKIDTFADEQCMVLQSGDSVAVLLGCSHLGVENNILAAMDVARTSKFDLVIGGMHLGGAEDARLYEIASFLKGREIGQIVCCHCTGDRAFDYLSDKLGERVKQGYVGMRWEL